MRILKCPHCKSTNVTLDTGGQTGKFICKDCKYIGGLIIQKRINNRNKKKFLRFPMETSRKKKQGDNMSICTREYTWKVWQFGVFKWSMITFGILVGAYFAGFWKKILWLVWIVFIVLTVLTLIIWFNSMKKKK